MGLELKNDFDLANQENGIECPLIDGKIKESNCLENTMVTAGFMKENTLFFQFKEKQNWREICRNCKYFKF